MKVDKISKKLNHELYLMSKFYQKKVDEAIQRQQKQFDHDIYKMRLLQKKEKTSLMHEHMNEIQKIISKMNDRNEEFGECINLKYEHNLVMVPWGHDQVS